eukprot:gnl/MRDRNA2_/MRDRNA2_32741_c0_seq2.p1 gnl/MRDRNA2_/MRDRNA2_32741_c0~~gnl/MRDRNA2_/MRDRNA2_32741_c0_seq2.p1  ORF type:complete len:620 (+),score=109.48 gnl/MRDRNA2_/MRDRNA2_32741_c0_seq2:171-2030(+)
MSNGPKKERKTDHAQRKRTLEEQNAAMQQEIENLRQENAELKGALESVPQRGCKSTLCLLICSCVCCLMLKLQMDSSWRVGQKTNLGQEKLSLGAKNHSFVAYISAPPSMSAKTVVVLTNSTTSSTTDGVSLKKTQDLNTHQLLPLPPAITTPAATTKVISSSSIAAAMTSRSSMNHSLDSGLPELGRQRKQVVLKAHVPKSEWSCNVQKETVRRACGDMEILPEQEKGGIEKMCGPRAQGGYIRHYQYFTYAVLVSTELQRWTGVRIQHTSDPFSADIVVCLPEGVRKYRDLAASKGIDPDSQLVLMVEDWDGGSLRVGPEVIRKRSTLGVLKHFVMINRPGLCETPHGKKYLAIELLRLVQEGLDFRDHLTEGSLNAFLKNKRAHLLCKEPLDALTARKVKPAIPFFYTVKHYQGNQFSDGQPCQFAPFSEMRLIKERSIDIAWFGGLREGQVRWHRVSLMDHLSQITTMRPKWVMKYGQAMPVCKFYEMLQDTKLFLGPWGNGEWSIKDEEAVLAGAVLVKPGAKVLDSIFPLYANDSCFDVCLDWSDLESVLETALSDLDGLQRMQTIAHQRLQGFFTYGKAVKHKAVLSQFAELVNSAKAWKLKRGGDKFDSGA